MRNRLPTPDTLAINADDASIREGASSAFMRDRNVSVTERPHPEYQALGVPVAAFLIYPKLTQSAIYDDNAFAKSSGAIGDWVFQTKAEAQAASNWSRNQLEGFGSVTTYNYVTLTKLDTTDYHVGVDGRYDVVGNSNIYAGVEDGRYTMPFTNVSVPRDAVTAEQYDLVQGDVGAAQELNRLRFSESFDAADYQYWNLLDGRRHVLFEDMQDHFAYATQGKAEYAVSPATAVFGTFSWNERDYQKLGSQGSNSSGYELTVGASFDITHLMRGEAQVGYLQQNFDASPANHTPAKTVTGPAFHGKIEWFPTQLTTVTLQANREIEEWTVTGASGTLGSSGGVQLDYELLRNLILSCNVDVYQYRYIGLGRADNSWTFGALGKYLVNRNWGVSLSYARINQTSSFEGLSFRDDRVSLGVVFQY